MEQAEERTAEVDSGTLSLVGWCHCRLGQYDQALRFLIEALSLDTDLIHAQFDGALALMCDGRHGLALREYQRALDLSGDKHVLRCRGLLHVARDDLREAMEIQSALRKVPEAQEGLELPKKAFHETMASAAEMLGHD